MLVTGRISHFISAFGEHVIGKEVDQAMQRASAKFGFRINEFTVAPQVNPPEGGLPYHEWFVEFDSLPGEMDSVERYIDSRVREQNIYYNDLVEGKILRTLVIRPLAKDTFRSYMKKEGKLGGQNKVPRLKNDRSVASGLKEFILR